MKKSFLAILLFFSFNDTFSQLPTFKFQTNELVETSISQGLYMVRTQYQLKEVSTGKLYGRGGRQWFGRNFTIGFALPGGLVCSEVAFAPWTTDKNYDKYRGNDNYEPVLTDSISLRPLDSEGLFSNYPISISTRTEESSCQRLSITYPDTLTFSMDMRSGEEMNGWVVWVMDKENGKQDTPAIALTSYETSVNIPETERCTIDAPLRTETILGGCFVTAETKGVGIINLKLSGIIYKDGNEWLLYPVKRLAAVSNEVESQSDSSITDGGNDTTDDELTPLPSSKPKPRKVKIKK